MLVDTNEVFTDPESTMASPKSGSPGTVVSPAAPAEAKEADKADPGEVQEVKARERQFQQGKYGAQKAKPFKPPPKNEPTEDKTWIEICLIDHNDKPVAGEKYHLTLPDGSVAEGTLDDKGLARIKPVEPGSCKVKFPERPGQSWNPA